MAARLSGVLQLAWGALMSTPWCRRRFKAGTWPWAAAVITGMEWQRQCFVLLVFDVVGLVGVVPCISAPCWINRAIISTYPPAAAWTSGDTNGVEQLVF